MGTSFDVNVQLALATTAEYEGDLDLAREFIAAAQRAARTHRGAQAQVASFAARFHGRHRPRVPRLLLAAAF